MTDIKTPFCSVCLKSGVTCAACESNIKEKYSQFDFDICKYLYEKFSKHNIKSDLEYITSFRTKDAAILFMRGDIGSVIGHRGNGVKEISQKFGKRIKVVNLNNNIKDVISDIINPLELLGINKIFKDGTEKYKIRVSKKNIMQISFDIPTLEKVLNFLFNADVLLSFE